MNTLATTLAVIIMLGAAGAVAETTGPATPVAAKKEPLSVRIMDPREGITTTSRDFVNLLGRTAKDATVTIGGEAAPVFATGLFVRDRVALNMGENRIAVVVTASDGEKIERVVIVNRLEEKPPAAPPAVRSLEIDASSIEPSRNAILSRGEILEVSFRGTPGQAAEFQMFGKGWKPMTEVVDAESTMPTGVYRADFVATAADDVASQPVRMRLRAKPQGKSPVKIKGKRVVEVSSKARVGCWGESQLRLVRVKNDGTGLGFGLHEVRLGGPYAAELSSGTLLRVTGMRGGNYHVQLCPSRDAWVSLGDVELVPAGTPMPHLAFTNLSAYGDDNSDFVTIPFAERVPFAVTPTVSPAGRAAIDIDFFGAHNAATWISHRPTAKVIREVTTEQVATDHLRVRVELSGKQLWGYKVNVTAGSVVLAVRRAPQLAAEPDSPLKGLTIALEPGHGGSGSGARGLSGSEEKNINRMAVEELARQLEAAGAKTVIVRKGDEAPSLGERTRRVVESNAEVFISMHANAAGTERGYLRVSGTSTYYKHLFSRDLSEAIHARLLEKTKLGDFGNVGNFNYSPIRVATWMPSMLVEQAFMSNPEDEAKMLDPEFRKTMMNAVLLGIEDWLKAVRDGAGK
jgi:N-acetylmuramoyl-L-alanine amidase